MTDLEQAKKQRGALATEQQRKAANPNRSVWVEASAGTGKTKVLSDRVLRILLSGVNPSKILCLTYTKAAAVEMNSRIAGRLSKWAVAKDDELDKELIALLGLLPDSKEEYDKLTAMARKLFAMLLDTPGGMKIQTIHSFCQEILKRFPLEAKISPYFEVMDDRTASEALAEVKKTLLQKIESDSESSTAKSLAFLTKNISEYKFPEIMSEIANNRSKIARMLEAYPEMENILEALAERLNINVVDNDQELISEFFEKTDTVIIKQIMEAWFHGSPTDVKKAEVLASFLAGDSKSYIDYKSLFLKKEGGAYAKSGTKEALAYYPDLPKVFNDEVARLQNLENKLLALKIFASTKAVLYLAEDLIKGYNNYKKAHSKMDYEDLIVITRNLLENKAVADWVLFKLDGGIDNVLIDEAQDTSPNQWAIIRSITEEFFSGFGAREKTRTVFAVGDRKQSIYSFQGADPQEFENMRQHFSAKAEEFDEVHLDVSFRSTASVLDSVNNVFSDEYAKKGVVLEGQDITHIPFRIGDGGKVELWPLIEPIEGEKDNTWRPPVERVTGDSTSSRLAKQIALQIKNVVEGQEILVSQNRPLRYKDFMVLVQRRNSFVEELVRECKNINVNIAGIDKIKLLEQIAIQDLIAVGQFLLLPTDDLTLATILKSPIFGLDDDDLFKLCYNRGGLSLWSRLGIDKTYADVYQVLQKLLDMADFIRPFELYSYLLNKLGGRKKFVERMGFEVEDGLDEFINLTLNFEMEHIPSLQNFISWVGKDEIEIKRELEQSEVDAVRIMTVHGSKGLQSPVVILPDTVRIADMKKKSEMLWDELFYFPLSAKDYDAKCQSIKQRDNDLQLEEYKRLLYVALTRAEDRLCVCGYRKKNACKPESWYEICRKSFGQLGHCDDKGIIHYETTQQIAPKEEKQKIAKDLSVPDFDWIKAKAPIEGALAKPFAPSKPDDEEEPALVSPIGEKGKNRYRRGLIIHKLLQFLPDVKNSDKGGVIEEFLLKNAPDFNEFERKRIKSEVLKLLNDEKFGSLFGANSKAEIPIMGVFEGKIVSAVVDRLVVEKEQVLIIDFKTNRPAANSLADVPSVYLKQMRAYKELLQKIYPDKQVTTLILWTDTSQLMQVG